jgi:prepilin-type processing-associated H-X9-DG protein
LISFAETACDSRVSGRSDASYDEWFYYGRRRHDRGSQYLFLDSHVTFHRAPQALLAPDTEYVSRSYDFSKPRFGPVN